MTIYRTLTAIVTVYEGIEILKIEEPLYGIKQHCDYVPEETLGDQIEEALRSMDIDMTKRVGCSKVSDTQMNFLFSDTGRIIKSDFAPQNFPSCPYCGSEVTLEEEIIDYKYACIPCDINLSEIETVPHGGGISETQKRYIAQEAEIRGVEVDFKGARISCVDNSRVMIDEGDGLFVSIIHGTDYQTVYIPYDDVCPKKFEFFVKENPDLKNEDRSWIVKQMVIGEHHSSFSPYGFKLTGKYGWEEFYDYNEPTEKPQTKTLQKKMVYDEMQAYLKKRPEYRLITQEELDEFKEDAPDGRFFIEGVKVYDADSPFAHPTMPDLAYPLIAVLDKGEWNTYYGSPWFKFQVFLVKEVKDA